MKEVKFSVVWLVLMVYLMGFSSHAIVVDGNRDHITTFILATVSALINAYYVDKALKK